MIRFLRTDGDSSEVLTVVRIDRSRTIRTGKLAIQITTGLDVGSDFVGLYNLDDGEQLTTGNSDWSAVHDLPAAQIAQIEENWATGTSCVERLV